MPVCAGTGGAGGLGEVAPLDPPDGIAEDEEGDDGQGGDPVDADVEGEGGVEGLEAERGDEVDDLVIEGVEVGGDGASPIGLTHFSPSIPPPKGLFALMISANLCLRLKRFRSGDMPCKQTLNCPNPRR